LEDDEERLAWWYKKFGEKCGLLHQMHFYRIVLDEAHCIKSAISAKYIACNALRATYRWLLTGTPIVDGLEELYAYLKFLKEKNSGVYS
jgi:SNF2 family DNA or RNA helicase